MIIKSLTLENIGPFVGTARFDFSTNDKNIILIGGKNGSGKTTILKSIKFGLFGSYSLGFKSDSFTYFQEIKGMLNNIMGDKSHYISVNFSFTENYSEMECSVKRSWIYEGRDIKEICEVLLNQTLLSIEDQYEFFQKLRTVISPKLVDSFIFDGEKVGRIIEEGGIEQYLKDTFDAMFNITILEQMNIDLLNYANSKSSKLNNSSELQLLELINEIKVLSKKLSELENEKIQLEQKYNHNKTVKKSLSNLFKDLGGLSDLERENLENTLSNELKTKEEFSKKFKNFLENDVVMFLNTELIDKGLNQIKTELPKLYIRQLQEINEELRSKEIEQLIIKMDNKEEILPIHNMSKAEYLLVQNKMKDFDNWRELVKIYLDESQKNKVKIDDLKNKIISGENARKLDYYLHEIQIVEKNLRDLSIQLNEIEHKITLHIERKDELHNKYEALNSIIKRSYSYDNSFILSMRAMDINKSFINHIAQKNRIKVSNYATEVVDEIMRKKGFISRVDIGDLFDIHIYDKYGMEMDLVMLSAGEKQLLISTLIYSMVKVSGKELFFVFDTPLARLDLENRSNFISYIIKKISKQSIVLSTDSEFTDSYLRLIQDSTIRKYKLDYVEHLRSTKVVDGYFGDVDYA